MEAFTYFTLDGFEVHKIYFSKAMKDSLDEKNPLEYLQRCLKEGQVTCGGVPGVRDTSSA